MQAKGTLSGTLPSPYLSQPPTQSPETCTAHSELWDICSCPQLIQVIQNCNSKQAAMASSNCASSIRLLPLALSRSEQTSLHQMWRGQALQGCQRPCQIYYGHAYLHNPSFRIASANGIVKCEGPSWEGYPANTQLSYPLNTSTSACYIHGAVAACRNIFTVLLWWQ